ncbi:uncharacterized protein LOC105429847 [Pogonomyrmex barbatus]|uniref:Uncharacterized protein LOC105429847 n=1 Tax=Pogonomyrmex barbatus TaxID=144034 RepID=A0A6I9WJ10_9HYME|nr:uncharacterized protein LOC105429847 [Pogonomyrmex barbatus]
MFSSTKSYTYSALKGTEAHCYFFFHAVRTVSVHQFVSNSISRCQSKYIFSPSTSDQVSWRHRFHLHHLAGPKSPAFQNNMRSTSSSLSDAQRRRRALKRLRYRRNKRARRSANYLSPRTSKVFTRAEEITSCSNTRPYSLCMSPPSYSPIRPSESGSLPDFRALFPERHDTNFQYPDFLTKESLDEFCGLLPLLP